MNLRLLLLKTEKFLDFLRWGSSLIHSIMVDGEKEFLKKIVFSVNKGGIMYISSRV